ncbi:MAG: NfeD family protein [Actinomycetota bacterium]
MTITRRLGLTALAVAAVFLAIPHALGAPNAQGGAVVRLIEQTGTVDPLTAKYVERSIAAAERDNAVAVVVRLDTPGGLDSAMRRIIKAIQASKVPVLCWVGPPGARAASAGAFILISCPFAAMAPGTNVGAAHPVGITGDILSEKVTNDAAAYIRSLAQSRGRNADWAERAVRDSISASAEEAHRLEVIDLVVPTIPELLRQTNGLTIPVGEGGTATLNATGALLEKAKLSPGEALLHLFIAPDIAFLFFAFGVAGIVYEILNPGLNLAGVVGLIMLIASFVILGMLPVNVAGLILIAAAIGFFILDALVVGHGLPTVAGILSLVLGGLFLFDASVPNASVSKGFLVGISVALGAFFFFIVRAALKTRRQTPVAGQESLVGMVGTVRSVLDPHGIVHAQGEEWTARSSAGEIRAGTSVRVTAIEGLTLVVEPVEAGSESHPTEEGVR